MATISITVPDTLVPRIVTAMRAKFPQYSDLTDGACFKQITADYWRGVLINYEAQQAEANLRTQSATTQAQTAIDAGGIG